jgi:phosphatidylglycerol---prolipoprotein diacylglyceryl transferase
LIHVPTNPQVHILFDLLAWASAAGAGWWVKRRDPDGIARLERIAEPSYFIALAVGAIIGAWFLGSLNSLRWSNPTLSHSVGGALAGGIVAVELWKWRMGVRGSTGGSFVLPMAVGIMVGRFGCFFSGIADRTYGTETALPWAVDLGDGVGRHPVQLYEAGVMALFALWYLMPRFIKFELPHLSARPELVEGSSLLLTFYWRTRRKEGQPFGKLRVSGGGLRSLRVSLSRRTLNPRTIFYTFIAVYAAQRFIWEFVKPYPPVMFGLNVFHFLMLGLIAYAAVYARNARDLSPARA